MATQVIQQGDYPGLIIDPLDSTITAQKLKLDIREDIYNNHFKNQSHLNFICTEPNNQHYIISVLSKATNNNTYRALKTTLKGSEEFEIMGYDKNLSTEDTIERMLIKEGHNCVLITNPDFTNEIANIEQKHPQKRTAMKLGVISCKHNQVEPKAMFANGRDTNRCDPKFWKFVNSITQQINLVGWKGYRGDMREPGFAYYAQWNSIEIIYHIAPILNEEETRRLIGNDVGYLIFLDEGHNTKFDPSRIDQFGEVPQVFAVIQPVKETYRVGFFQKRNILPHSPQSPSRLLSLEEARDFILTKLYNGLVMTTYCPPLNRLFYKPRQDTLDSICRKFLAGVPRKKGGFTSSNIHEKRKDTIPKKIDTEKKNLKISLKENNIQVTFISDAQGYNSINSLVLLIASNISYFEGNEVKLDCHEQLGLDSVLAFSHKMTETYGYIAYDKEKWIIVFRGFPNEAKMKKSLAHGKKGKIEIKKLNMVLPGQVFSMFSKSINGIWEKIDIVMSKIYQNQKIFLCGHDTGGCLAILAAHLLHLRGNKVSAVYSYGSPKVGDLTWNQSYPSELNQVTFRVAHHSDFIPAHPTERYWFHVGKIHNVGSAKEIISDENPHSIVSYFNALELPHKSAVEKLHAHNTNAPVDRILATTSNIRDRISTRHNLEPNKMNIDTPNAVKINKNSSNYVTNTNRIPREDYEEDALISRGLKKQTAPVQISKKNSEAVPQISRRKSTGHMEPLLPPTLTTFFRNNLMSLLDMFKNVRPVVYGNVPAQDLERNLINIGKRLKVMDGVLLKITVQHESVQYFSAKIREFLVSSGIFWRLCMRICRNGNFPPAPNLLDEFNKRFVMLLPIAKVISESAKALMIPCT